MPDSWEEEAARDEKLAQQAQQQLNMGNNSNQQGRGGFRGSANTFQPGAASFNPGQPYGGGYQQQQYGYPQYGAQPGYGAPQQGYGAIYGQGQYQGGYNQAYGEALNDIRLAAAVPY